MQVGGGCYDRAGKRGVVPPKPAVFSPRRCPTHHLRQRARQTVPWRDSRHVCALARGLPDRGAYTNNIQRFAWEHTFDASSESTLLLSLLSTSSPYCNVDHECVCPHVNGVIGLLSYLSTCAYFHPVDTFVFSAPSVANTMHGDMHAARCIHARAHPFGTLSSLPPSVSPYISPHRGGRIRCCAALPFMHVRRQIRPSRGGLTSSDTAETTYGTISWCPAATPPGGAGRGLPHKGSLSSLSGGTRTTKE